MVSSINLPPGQASALPCPSALDYLGQLKDASWERLCGLNHHKGQPLAILYLRLLHLNDCFHFSRNFFLSRAYLWSLISATVS